MGSIIFNDIDNQRCLNHQVEPFWLFKCIKSKYVNADGIESVFRAQVNCTEQSLDATSEHI